MYLHRQRLVQSSELRVGGFFQACDVVRVASQLKRAFRIAITWP